MSENTGPQEVKGAQGAPNNHPELPNYSEESASPPPGFLVGLSNPLWIRRIVVGIGVILLLLLMPPIYRAVKEWRSGVLLSEAELAFSTGDSTKAIDLLKQALALSPGSLRLQHAVELYNARSGDQASLSKLLERMRSSSSGPDELLGIAELEIAAAHTDLVKEALGALPPKLSDEQSLRRTLALASLIAQSGDLAKAAESCLAQVSSFSPDSSSHLKMQAALYLLATKSPDSEKSAVTLLQQAMKSGGRISLSAWRLLARIALTPSQGSTKFLTPDEISVLIKSLDTLSGHTTLDSLTAADLEILQDPKCNEKVVRRLKISYRDAPRIEALELARWLNARGFQKDVVELAGSERPLKDTDWLLVTLDAETSLGNWNEVSRMLDSPAGAGLPDAVRHLFLARVALMNNDQNGADAEWRNLGGVLHLEKPETLAYVAGYEEQIGAFERAARTYREMADRQGSTKIRGLIGLIRCQPRNTPAVKLIPMYEELVAAAPNMTDAQSDLAYLKLLISDDVEEASKTAENLLATQPNNLVRISAAALGRLRTGNPKGALDLYKGKEIDWASFPDPWKGVNVAVLRANDDFESAAKLLALIDQKNLRPEEAALITSTAQKKNQKP